VNPLSKVFASEFLSLPYTDDLTRSNLAYTSNALPSLDWRVRVNSCSFPQSVAKIAVELALRRYLDWEEIPHQYFQAKPFSDPDRLDRLVG
jgi:hypothetical protein